MNDTERLVFLTRHYRRLQNLRLAPAYAFVIATPWIDRWDVSTGADLMGLGACIAWYWLLKIYYKQRYGWIEGNRILAHRDSLPYAVGALFAFVAYFMLRGQHTVSWLLLIIPGIVFAEGLSPYNINLRRCYYLAAGVVFLLVLLPDLFRGMPGHEFFHVYDFAFFGSILLTLSILDHILLTHSFHHVPGENHV